MASVPVYWKLLYIFLTALQAMSLAGTGNQAMSGNSFDSKSTLLSDANHGYNIFQKYSQRLKSRKSNQLERGNLAASDSRPISNYLRFRKDSYTRVRLRRDSSPSLYWKKKELTWRLQNYTSDLPPNLTHWIIKRAFTKWQSAADIHFTEMPSGQVDIMIAFIKGEKEFVGHYYDHREPDPNLRGDIHFNDNRHFTFNEHTGINLLLAAMHIIGHVLGLEKHSTNSSAIMYYPDVYQLDYDLADDDISRIQAIYGKPLTTTVKTTRKTTTRTTTSKSTRKVTKAMTSSSLTSGKPPEETEHVAESKVNRTAKPVLSPDKRNEDKKHQTLFIVVIILAVLVAIFVSAGAALICTRKYKSWKRRRSRLVTYRDSTSLTVRFEKTGSMIKPKPDSFGKHSLKINTFSKTEIRSLARNGTISEPCYLEPVPLEDNSIEGNNNGIKRMKRANTLPTVDTAWKGRTFSGTKKSSFEGFKPAPRRLSSRENGKFEEPRYMAARPLVESSCMKTKRSTSETSQVETNFATDISLLENEDGEREPLYLEILPSETSCSESTYSNTTPNKRRAVSLRDLKAVSPDDTESLGSPKVIPGSTCKLFHQSTSEIDSTVSKNFAQYIQIDTTNILYKVPSGIAKHKPPQVSPPSLDKEDRYLFDNCDSTVYDTTPSPYMEPLLKTNTADESGYINQR